MRPPNLPPEFDWFPPSWETIDSARRVLMVGGRFGVEIVLVRERVDGPMWTATVNRHLPWQRHRTAIHPNREFAMKMAGRWVAAQATRILAELEDRGRGARHDGWLSVG